MTRAAQAPKKSAARKSRPGESGPITLEYHLDALPSSQHRAGLAGLVLMHRWLEQQRDDRAEPAGVCEVELRGTRGLTLRMDRAGLAELLDLIYGAAEDERAYPKPFKNKAPRREETRTETDAKTGKTREKTVYIYPAVVPRGAFLADWDPSRDSADNPGIWIKLWRDMLWNILRGVPATRAPFEARAQGQPDKLAAQIWQDLRAPDQPVDLPSTYYLGAMAKTAENVSFRDRARDQFVLHFWPFVAQIYVPQAVDIDGKRDFVGYALAVPDVADLPDFCDELAEAMNARETEVAGYVPRQAVVDLPAESALDLMVRLTERMQHKNQFAEDLMTGVDVFHVAKEGNNVRILGSARVDIDRPAVDAYKNIRDKLRDHRFRRQRLLNLLGHAPWYAGFDRLLATTPQKQTIQSPWFRHDCRQTFQERIEERKTMSEQDQETKPDIESLIYQLVNVYIGGRLKSKYDFDWSSVKALPEDSPRRQEYGKKRRDIANDAFLAIRSRTGDDFIAYFSGTLFSVPQKQLREDDFVTLSRALHEHTDKVRTLTLLALSARS